MEERKSPKRDKDVIAYQGFSGIRNDIPSHRFSPEDLEAAVNVDLDQSGGASRRERQLKLSSTASHSLWSDNVTALLVQSGVLKRLNPDYTTSSLKTLASNAPMSFQKVNEPIYFGNGVDNGIVQNGVVRSWGLPVPPAFKATAVSGIMPGGDYQFTLTYLRDGQESGAGLAGVISLADRSGIQFDLPVPTDSTITGKQLYLSTANGDVLYVALQIPATATTVSYLGDTSELAYELDKQFLTAPPAGHLIGYFKGCMYVAVGNVLYHSEPYGYELFDLRKYLQFDSKVTMFAPIDDEGVFIGTQTSHAWIPGSNPDEFRYVPKADYGAIPGAMAYIDGAMWGDHSLGARQLPMWLSQQGICLGVPGGSIDNITRSKYLFSAHGSGCALFRPDATSFIAAVNH